MIVGEGTRFCRFTPEGPAMTSLDRPLAPNPYDLLPPVPSFILESDDLQDGQALPPLHSAEGGNVSPHLRWSDFPEETQSFVVSCFDPDAPTPSGWWHWTIVDLDASTTELTQGQGGSDLLLDGAAFHLRVDHGGAEYFGAAPPPQDRPHRYIFAIHALDVETLGIDDEATPAECAFHLAFHTIARATLTATYAIA